MFKVNLWIISYKNTICSAELLIEKKVEKLVKKWLTLVKANGIIFKLTRERQRKQKKNKKVLDKAKQIW